jgi:hypothetical protein
MTQICKEFSVPLAQLCPKTFDSFSAFDEYCKSAKGTEGYVIRFADGRMYKMKTTWYLQQTSGSSPISTSKEYFLQSERLLWFLMLEDHFDDVYATMKDDEWRERAKSFHVRLQSEIEKVSAEFEKKMTEYQILGEKEKQSFITQLQSQEYLYLQALLKSKDQDARQVLVKLILGDSTPKHFELMQKLLNKISVLDTKLEVK